MFDYNFNQQISLYTEPLLL